MRPGTFRLMKRIAMRDKLEAELRAKTARLEAERHHRDQEALSHYVARIGGENQGEGQLTGAQFADLSKFVSAGLAAATNTAHLSQQALRREQAALREWGAAHEREKSLSNSIDEGIRREAERIDRLVTQGIGGGKRR